jgi:hypothetical protein
MKKMEELKMNPMDSRQRELFGYIQQYHPYLLSDPQAVAELILLKAARADRAYCNCINAGRNAWEAEETAHAELYAGLHFSPVTYIQEIVIDKFGREVNNEIVLHVYTTARPVFDKYSPGDDFEGSEQEEALTEELLPFIKSYIG